MRHNRLHPILPVIGLLTVSCTMELENSTTIENGLVEIYAPAVGFETATKTAIGTDSNGALNILWTPGDKIGVFGDICDNVPFVNNAGTASSTATFSARMEECGTLRHAYYPFREDAVLNSIPAEIGPVQDGSFNPEYDIKAGTVKGGKINVRHLAAMLRINVNLSNLSIANRLYDDADDPIPSSEYLYPDYDERISMIQIVTDNGITGSYTYDLTDPDAGLKVAEYELSELLLAFTDDKPLANDGNVTFYAAIAPGIKAGDSITFTIDTENSEYNEATESICREVFFTVTASQDLLGGRCYDMPLTAAGLNGKMADGGATMWVAWDTEAPKPSHSIIKDTDIEGGVVRTYVTSAQEGGEVHLMYTAASGYVFDHFVVTDAEGDVALQESDGGWFFIMPASDVTISAVFNKIPETDPDAAHEWRLVTSSDGIGIGDKIVFVSAGRATDDCCYSMIPALRQTERVRSVRVEVDENTGLCTFTDTEPTIFTVTATQYAGTYNFVEDGTENYLATTAGNVVTIVPVKQISGSYSYNWSFNSMDANGIARLDHGYPNTSALTCAEGLWSFSSSMTYSFTNETTLIRIFRYTAL